MAFAGQATGRVKDTAGVRQRRLLTYTGVAYPTGGEAITPQQLGLGVIEYVPDFWITNGTLAVLCKFNYTTSKLMCFWSGTAGAGLGEVTNLTSLTGYSGRVEVFGR